MKLAINEWLEGKVESHTKEIVVLLYAEEIRDDD